MHIKKMRIAAAAAVSFLTGLQDAKASDIVVLDDLFSKSSDNTINLDLNTLRSENLSVGLLSNAIDDVVSGQKVDNADLGFVVEVDGLTSAQTVAADTSKDVYNGGYKWDLVSAVNVDNVHYEKVETQTQATSYLSHGEDVTQVTGEGNTPTPTQATTTSSTCHAELVLYK